MNIKITYNWLLEYLDTDADPYELQKYLSLCGPSIERVDKIGDDYVFDVEITSNRIDTASVMGIAREAQAILPQFGKKAKLKKVDFGTPGKSIKNLPLTITDKNILCNRLIGVVLDNAHLGPSPEYIRTRLERCDIRPLNNIIDITNYVMLETGHPTHAFDYDRIKSHTLELRKAKKGEQLITLDEKKHILTENDIIIDDGTGEIIDLPGIMGTANSVITDKTKRVLFFTENNNPQAIRRTSMRLGIRTDAATINDKGPDPELTMTAFTRGIQLFETVAKAKVASPIIDMYPNKRTEKQVTTYLTDIQRVMGVPIEEKKIITILTDLGFGVERQEEEDMAYPDCVKFQITVPTYRVDDVEIKEDIIEEVARVYGYGNLPSNISPMVYIKQPREIERLFTLQSKIKYLLKYLGLHESMNYSMISKDLIEKLGQNPLDFLKLANTISEEIEYLRISLLPSLIKNMADNQGKKDMLKFFEISKVYPKVKDKQPNEQYTLGIAVNTDFFDLKGILETICTTLHIKSLSFKKSARRLFAQNMQADLIDSSTGKTIGSIGQLKQQFAEAVGLRENIYLAKLDFDFITTHAQIVEPVREPLQFAQIKRDITLTPGTQTYDDVKTGILKTSSFIQDIEYLQTYKDTISLRLYFSSKKKNITEKEVNTELEKILKVISP